jgi:GMP synthase-like glutamine amidotransferase
MSVLILKNIVTEGPGTIEGFLNSKGIDYRIVELSSKKIPDVDLFGTVLILGGPMSVHDAGIYPYIKDEIELVRETIQKGKRILGICLGSQIIAYALGARVYKGNESEIGWYDIEITESGFDDPLMRELASDDNRNASGNKLKVFQLHGETFDIPEGAVKIASSELYPNQAFRYGKDVYALQFHIEVSENMIYEWLKGEPVDFERLKIETEDYYEDYHHRSMNFIKAFFNVL